MESIKSLNFQKSGIDKMGKDVLILTKGKLE